MPKSNIPKSTFDSQGNVVAMSDQKIKLWRPGSQKFIDLIPDAKCAEEVTVIPLANPDTNGPSCKRYGAMTTQLTRWYRSGTTFYRICIAIQPERAAAPNSYACYAKFPCKAPCIHCRD